MTEAVVNQNQQAQAFSPFGKRNANKDKEYIWIAKFLMLSLC